MDVMKILQDCGTKEVSHLNLSERILENLESKGPTSFGVLKNRMRRKDPKEIAEALQSLADRGLIGCEVIYHPITNRKSAFFHATQKETTE